MLALDVFRGLDRAGVRYCVWKGSIHLDASLAGESDLDVLIESGQRDAAYGVFASHGCRTTRVAPRRADVGVEDILGFDPRSGRMVHFHVYHRLVLGERHLDRYRLPWERSVLDARRSVGDVYLADPADEAVLLLIRAALRLTVTARALTRLGIANRGVRGELEWLVRRTDRTQFLKTLEGRLGPAAVRDGERCLERGPTAADLTSLRQKTKRVLASQRSVRGPRAVARRWLRIGAWARRGVYRRYLERPSFLARGPLGGGMLVAIVGADGSGKSSLARDLRRSLSEKLDVMYVYLGSGDGPASLIRWPMKLVHRRLLRTGSRSGEQREGRRDAGWFGLARVVWALALANEKQRKLSKAMIARSRGLIVICDRYPQIQFPGQNDGPLLSAWRSSPSAIRRSLARYEGRPYRLAAILVPDLVLRLNVDEATALARRPNLDPEYLRRRIELTSVLSFEGSLFGAVELDSTQPYRQVFGQAVEAIWART